MTREIDNPIPDIELLFRAVHTDHVDGDRVLEAAVEVPEMSTNRNKYCDLQSPLLKNRPQDTGVASITKSTFPPRETINDVTYRFGAVDWPEEDNEAHAHVSVEKSEGPCFVAVKKLKPAPKQKLRIALAGKMYLEIPPK